MTKELQFVDAIKRASEFRGTHLERQRIIAIIENIRDTWERTPSFNYRNELNSIIAQIKGESK